MKKIKSGFVFNSKFGKYEGDIQISSYEDNNIRLDMVDGYGVIAGITKNVMFPLGKNEIAVKDYSENEGILKDLVEQGVVRKLNHSLGSGFVKLELCEIIIPLD